MSCHTTPFEFILCPGGCLPEAPNQPVTARECISYVKSLGTQTWMAAYGHPRFTSCRGARGKWTERKQYVTLSWYFLSFFVDPVLLSSITHAHAHLLARPSATRRYTYTFTYPTKHTRVTGISPLYSIVFSEKKREEVIHKQQIREFQELFCRIGSHWQDTHRLTLHQKPSYTCTPTYTRNIHAYTRRLLLVCTALFGDFSAGPRTRSWK